MSSCASPVDEMDYLIHTRIFRRLRKQQSVRHNKNQRKKIQISYKSISVAKSQNKVQRGQYGTKKYSEAEKVGKKRKLKLITIVPDKEMELS